MIITFLGATKTVTGSFFVIETGNVRFAVDCGMFQGSKQLKEKNYSDFPIEPGSLQFVILTHAHIDHSGLIPKLCKEGFKGPIYTSPATAELCGIMFPDAGHIQETEVEMKNRKLSRAGKTLLEPIYTAEEALECLPQLQPLNYDEIRRVAPGVEVRLRDAGHILGSSIVELWVQENGQRAKVVFSGDLGQGGQPIVKDPTVVEGADYVIMESTYGNRLHKGTATRVEQLKKIIDDTMRRGGNLIIPSFAVERTQDILYDLSILQANGDLDPSIEIFIDSPLAIAETEIFQKSIDYYDQETMEILSSGRHPLKLPNLKFSRTREDSVELNNRLGNTIIISASGMADAGRIKYHLKYNLWRPESTVLFVGYQAMGTLGRRILDGEKMVTIHGDQLVVKADIQSIEAYSAHADQVGLLNWLKHFKPKPKTVFLVHGEEKAQPVLADLIQTEMNIPVLIPGWLDAFELTPQGVLVEGTMVQAHELPEHRAVEVNKALVAERKYLELRTRLNNLFQEKCDRALYDELIESLDKIAGNM
ncbi:MAG: MBL fold metallo-hydrolase [Syntrophomonadaceae bacterium]|nr:MBL fold metallo-hydrolase [Syntrophomonadaceae bacterium]